MHISIPERIHSGQEKINSIVTAKPLRWPTKKHLSMRPYVFILVIIQCSAPRRYAQPADLVLQETTQEHLAAPPSDAVAVPDNDGV